jgi:hypothetical protein
MPPVQHIEFGQVMGGTVERQTAHFYRINVTDQGSN